MSDSEKQNLLDKILSDRKQAGTETDKPVFDEILTLEAQLAEVLAAGVELPFFREKLANETDFSSYDYLGFAQDKRVSESAIEAIRKYGTSVGASRVVGGQLDLHRELETEIADLMGTEDAVVFVSGHATNVTTIGHLLGPRDLILHDALSHNSIMQGAILSGARRLPFPHNDPMAARRILSQQRDRYTRVLLVVEGVYSMDGDISPLPAFAELKQEFDTLLMVDEAHSMGTLGETGRGIREHFDLSADSVDLWMGTLSKSLASCGGYIAASGRIVDYLRYTAPGFLFSVGLSPGDTAAALAACKLLKAEPQHHLQLQKNIQMFFECAKSCELGLGTNHGTPVIPVVTPDSRQCLQLAHKLVQQGIRVHPMIYPAVAEDAARLRFFITARHTPHDLEFAVNTLAKYQAKLLPRL